MSNNSLNWDNLIQAVELAQKEAQRLGLEPHHLAEKKRATAAIAGDYTGGAGIG